MEVDIAPGSSWVRRGTISAVSDGSVVKVRGEVILSACIFNGLNPPYLTGIEILRALQQQVSEVIKGDSCVGLVRNHRAINDSNNLVIYEIDCNDSDSAEQVAEALN